MKKIVVISDSFKGSLSSTDICEIVTEEKGRFFSTCEVVGIPVADGGEGTIDSFLKSMNGEKVWLEVTGRDFERWKAYYGKFSETAIIEMATAAGLLPVGKYVALNLTLRRMD